MGNNLSHSSVIYDKAGLWLQRDDKALDVLKCLQEEAPQHHLSARPLAAHQAEQPKCPLEDVRDCESRKGMGIRNALAQPKRVIGDIVPSGYPSSLEAEFWPHGSWWQTSIDFSKVRISAVIYGTD